MEFKDAEPLLAASILTAYPPFIIVGPNKIGKTELIRAECEYYNKDGEIVKFTTGADYGGLQQFLQYTNKDVRTIALSDIQKILSRKVTIAHSTFGYISTLVEEGISEELTYIKTTRESINKKINFIIGSTPKHTVHLVRLDEIDFMTRFLYIPVERNIKDVDMTKDYPLQQLPTSFDRAKLLNWTLLGQMEVHGESPRDAKMLNHLFLTLLAMGYEVSYVNELMSKILIFIPPEDTDYSWQKLYSRILKPL